MKKTLEGGWAFVWAIVNIIAKIRINLMGKQIEFQHIMREGNKLTDYIENLAIDTGDCSFVHTNSMNSTGKSILNSDKLTTPYLKVPPKRSRELGTKATA